MNADLLDGQQGSYYLDTSATAQTKSGELTADKFISNNNGNGTNFKLGDDAWIGDINVENTFRISGVQNSDRGYITFGNDATSLGRAGTGALTWGSNLEVQGKGIFGSSSLNTFVLSIDGLGESYNGVSGSGKGAYNVAGTLATISATSNSVNSGALIDFNAYNSGGGATGAFIGAVAGSTGNGPANFVIGRRTGTTSWAESVRVDTSGNVGIGITNPTKKLEVAGGEVSFSTNTAGKDTHLFTTNASNDGRYLIKSDTTTKVDIQANGNTYFNGGNFGIGTINPGYKLEVNGSFAATTKSFIIPHPTKENYKLRYACLEGPENSVYIRGRSKNCIIELPEYWTNLVHEDSITVTLTPIGDSVNPRIRKIENNQVEVFTKEEGKLDYYYIIFAERKDVDRLEVEIKG